MRLKIIPPMSGNTCAGQMERGIYQTQFSLQQLFQGFWRCWNKRRIKTKIPLTDGRPGKSAP
jgi:hypothetical protein